ncbi:16484_t:CDS:1, partial [Racocetra fulgida]
LYTKEKKQNEEYLSLLINARDYFGNWWESFLNNTKQYDDYSRNFVNDGQVENEEVIDLTNKDGVIDNEKDFDYEYYLNLDNTNLLDDC